MIVFHYQIILIKYLILIYLMLNPQEVLYIYKNTIKLLKVFHILKKKNIFY